MTDRKDDEKDATESTDSLHWKTSAAAAHSRDERKQTRDIDRKSDKFRTRQRRTCRRAKPRPAACGSGTKRRPAPASTRVSRDFVCSAGPRR